MRRRILVVDDLEAQRELCASELRDEGYHVDVAATGEEAVEALLESEPDLVILDMKLPGISGLEALGRMLHSRPDLPVIINSAYGSYRDNFMTWAATAYLIKSSDLTEVKTVVRRILARRKTA
ncbi:MAG: response regulator [Planctomycetota bacterium]